MAIKQIFHGFAAGTFLGALLLAVLLVNAWTLQSLWNWFLVPPTGFQPLSLPLSCGIILLFLFAGKAQLSALTADHEHPVRTFFINFSSTLIIWFFAWVLHFLV